MPTKQIYIREEDNELFEEAQRLSGLSSSAAVLDALRLYIATKKEGTVDKIPIEIKIGEESFRFMGIEEKKKGRKNGQV